MKKTHLRQWACTAMVLLCSASVYAAGVSVIPEAAFSGERGMRVLVNNTDPGYVEDGSPTALQRYRGRFWINLDNVTIADGEEFDVFQALNGADEIQFRLRIRGVSSANRLNVEVIDDNATGLSFNANGEAVLGGGWNAIEFDWQAASGPDANDGSFDLLVNGNVVPGFNGIDTDQRIVDKVRLGFVATLAPNFSDISGSFDIDEFVSRDDTMIGDTPTTSGIGDITVTEGTVEQVIDLFAAFDDTEDADADLTFTVEANTNAALFDNVAVDGVNGELTLAFAAAKVTGASDITIRATDTDNLYVETTFTVTVNPPPPDPASNPDPSDGLANVALDADLGWTAGNGADSHDVYFGTSDPPAFIQNQNETTYDPGSLDPETTYFWRIDEVNAQGTTQGDVWSFTTVPEPPVQASNPDPADQTTDVPRDNLELSWTAGARATSHDVYFGTEDPPTFIGNQPGATFTPSDPEYGTTYFWRIDEVNAGGTTQGEVWSFTIEEDPGVFGDVDGDDVVDAVDIQLVINNALGVANTPGADLNGSGDVDAVDVQLVINVVLGVI